ncbi:GspH/FimT family pseudopilin [Marinobacter sp.]|uniref:GspH/FimT family pseudopilin n=1 Tax=Marinobacter sp. TaxID=50741 RepID=UPI003A8DDF6F
MSGFQRSSGFTLLELIITIVILAIVASFAVPSFRETVLNNRLTSQINEASSLMSYARSEASKMQDGVITVCASADSASCSGANTWETGWIVMRDLDGDRVLDAGDDQLLRISQALEGGNTMRIAGLTSGGGSFVQFSGNGFPIPPGIGLSAAGTITVCDSRGAGAARAIVVSVSGQTRLARDTSGNGVLNDHNNANITCP